MFTIKSLGFDLLIAVQHVSTRFSRLELCPTFEQAKFLPSFFCKAFLKFPSTTTSWQFAADLLGMVE